MSNKEKQVAKVRRLQIILVIVLVAVSTAALIFFLSITARYKKVFLPSTTINGVDVSEKTAEEAWQTFHDLIQDYSLRLDFRNDQSETADAATIGYTYDNQEAFETLLEEQKPEGWVATEFGRTYEYTLAMEPVYDEEKLESWVRSLPEAQTENMSAPRDAYLARMEDDFIGIIAEDYGTTFDPDDLVAVTKSAISSKLRTLDVEATGIYTLPSVYSSDEDLNSDLEYLNHFLSSAVIYDVPGGQVSLDRHTTIEWITQPDGTFYIDTDTIQAKCVQFLAELGKKLDTSNSTLTFHSTNCGDIVFDTAQYGYITNEGLEIRYLLEDIISGTTVEREPAVFLNEEAPTVSDTYIEVDIRNQMAYYYKKNKLKWSSPVVTGCTDKGWDTPIGIFEIAELEKDTTLYGPKDEDGNYTYESHVAYWMQFAAGYGLHDADWRPTMNDFGGDIYKSNGSHGCVNLPVEKAAELFDMLEIGVQVFIFD